MQEMGWWSIVRKFLAGNEGESELREESVKEDEVEEWVRERLAETAGKWSFQEKAHEYMKEVKRIRNMASGEGEEIRRASRNFLESYDFGDGERPVYPIVEIVMFHDEIKEISQGEMVGSRCYEGLQELTWGFEKYLEESHLRTLWLLQQRVKKFREYGELRRQEMEVMRAKRERREHTLARLEDKKDELREVEARIGEGKGVLEDMSRLREEEIGYVEEIKSVLGMADTLLVEYINSKESIAVESDEGGKDEEEGRGGGIGDPREDARARLVRGYREDPAEYLSRDESLEIKRVFDEIRRGVETGELGRNVENAEFVVSELEKINLGMMRKRLQEIYQMLQETYSGEGMMLVHKKEELNYRIEHFEVQGGILDGQIQQLEARLTDIGEIMSREAGIIKNMAKAALMVSLEIV